MEFLSGLILGWNSGHIDWGGVAMRVIGLNSLEDSLPLMKGITQEQPIPPTYLLTIFYLPDTLKNKFYLDTRGPVQGFVHQ